MNARFINLVLGVFLHLELRYQAKDLGRVRTDGYS